MLSRARLLPLLKALALSNVDGTHNSADAGEDAVATIALLGWHCGPMNCLPILLYLHSLW